MRINGTTSLVRSQSQELTNMTNDDVDVNEDDDHQHHFDSNASVTQLPCIQSDGKPGT